MSRYNAQLYIYIAISVVMTIMMLFTVGVRTNLTTAGSGLVTRRGMGPQRGVDSAPSAGGAAASSGAGPRADRVPSLYIGEAEDYTGASGEHLASVYNHLFPAPAPCVSR